MGKRYIIVAEIAVFLTVISLFLLSCIPGASAIILGASQGNPASIKLIGGVFLVLALFWGAIVKRAWPKITVWEKVDGVEIYRKTRYL